MSNAALSLVVAHEVDAPAFGAFALAFAVFSFVVGLSRSLLTDPLMVRFAGADPRPARAAAGHAAGSALLLGLVTSCCLLAAAAVAAARNNNGLAAPLLVLAVGMPPLLVQDAIRGNLFAVRRPAAVTVLDTVWTLVEFLVAALLIMRGVGSVTWFMVAWIMGAAVSVAVALPMGAALPRVRGATGWLVRMRDLSGYYAIQYVAVLGTYQLTLFVISAIGSVTAVGSLRAAQVLLGPLNILVSGTLMFALPELSRRANRQRRQDLGVASAISGGLVLATVAWGTVLLLMPSRVGNALLGDTWASGREVLPATIVAQAAIAATIGPNAILRSNALARDVFRLSLLVAPPLFAGGVVGVAVAGAYGAALGFAIAQCAVVPMWWAVVLRRAGAGPRQSSESLGALAPTEGG